MSTPPELRSIHPEVPGWLSTMVSRLLEPRPADRIPTAEAALRVLARQKAPPRYRLRRWLLRAAAVGAVLGAVLGLAAAWLGRASPVERFSHLVPAGATSIAAVNGTGEVLWTVEGVDPGIADRGALARISPGGKPLIAIVLAPPGGWSPTKEHRLSLLEPATGRVVREVALPLGSAFFPADPPRFSFASARAIDLFEDGVDEILVNFIHVPEAPAYTVLYSPKLNLSRIIYYSRGGQGFQEVADLNGDGEPELLFAGINNGWNWVNVVAAVQLDLRSFERGEWVPVGAPDVVDEPSQRRLLYWYATLPRGHLEAPYCLTLGQHKEEIEVRYRDGRTLSLGFDGFPRNLAAAFNREEAAVSRRSTHSSLREAERLRQAGKLDLALAAADAAIGSSAISQEPWLGQYARRVRGKVLTAMGETEEAEAVFSELADQAEDAPEVAYDAAVAFHLHGDLERAVAWYEQGLGRASSMGAGKSKHEFLKGTVLALIELELHAEALAAIARFRATFPGWEDHLWLFREFVRWRSGEAPLIVSPTIPGNFIDLERYWHLELLYASGVSAESILGAVDTHLEEKPETQVELLSLRAEALSRLGRQDEASIAAGAAVQQERANAAFSIIARGHLGLVESRYRRFALDTPSSEGNLPTTRTRGL